MKTFAIVLLISVLVAAPTTGQIDTPAIDSPINGHEATIAEINEPEVGHGSTPNGVNADQVFQVIPSEDSPVDPVTAGVVDNDPELSVGRKMLSGRKMLDNLALTGSGVSAGADGDGVTSTLSGEGQSNIPEGEINDSHIEPHQDVTTVTADGNSITTGVGADPDALAGEGDTGVVYTVPGRK